MSNLRIGLVGLGRMGQNHLRVLGTLRGVDLVGLCDVDFALAQKCAAQFATRAFESAVELAQNVDTLVLVTPTSVHFEQVLQLIPLVKNLFVEKPLVSTSAQNREVLELAVQHGCQIQVGFIERFNPAVGVLRGIFETLGQPLQVDFARMNKFSARIRDVDVVTDLMIHDLDLALSLFGPVDRVQAYGFKDEENSVAFARAQLWHAQGTVSQVTASRMTDRRIRQIHAMCKDGFVDANLLRREVEVHRQYVEKYEGEITVSARVDSVDVRPQESLLLELQNFVASSMGAGPTLCAGAQQSLDAILLCEQILAQIH